MSRPGSAGRMLAAFGLLTPVLALSGVTVGSPAMPSEHAVAAGPPPFAAGLYQIRCWQQGRLLFEDRITLPRDAAAYGIRVSGTDRNGRPMYLAETHDATCLMRAAPEERALPP